MIAWGNLFFNSLWILGCALALAAVSYGGYRAAQERLGLRRAIGTRASQAVLSLAGVLFCAGLAGTAQRWWESAAWAGLGLLFAVQVGLAARLSGESLSADTQNDAGV